MEKKRLDLILMELGFARSRSQARDLIESGAVSIRGLDNLKPSTELLLEPGLREQISLEATGVTEFVSRAGHKLKGALDRTTLDVRGLCCLDIGVSTGGFSDCLLQRGAAQVFGVDVGHDQTDARLRQDPRFRVFEGVNARALEQHEAAREFPAEGFGLIVIDVSFISLDLVLPSVTKFAAKAGKLLALVKPQFEAGPEALDKNGIIRDAAVYESVENKIRSTCARIGWKIEDYFESGITGRDGNQEFFVYAHREG